MADQSFAVAGIMIFAAGAAAIVSIVVILTGIIAAQSLWKKRGRTP